MTTRLVLIRHARVETRSRLCGSLDLPLSPEGREQVEALALQTPRHPSPDALYTSPLTRAHEVAAALSRLWRLEPCQAPWAGEIHCGRFEGMSLEEIQRGFPALWARNEAQVDQDFAWPGGETYREFRVRILSGLQAIVTSHRGGRVALVTHSGVISQVLGTLRGRPAAVWAPDRPRPLTATEVEWSNGSPQRLVRYDAVDWY